MPRVVRPGTRWRHAPEVVVAHAAVACEPEHRPLERVAGVALRLAAFLASGATEQVERPIALDDDHPGGEELALAPRLEDHGLPRTLPARAHAIR